MKKLMFLSPCKNAICLAAWLMMYCPFGFGEEPLLPPSLLMDMLYISGELNGISKPDYLGPVAILTSPDGSVLYVAQKGARRVDVVNTQTGTATASISLPDEPTGMAMRADGASLYITCASEQRPMGTVTVVSTATGQVARSIAAGHFPRAPVLSEDEQFLYVSNQFKGSVAKINLSTRQVTKNIPVIREPSAAVLTPDGNRLIVANFIPSGPSNTDSTRSHVSIINTQTDVVAAHIPLVIGSQSVTGVEVSPDGNYAYVTHILSRFTIPTTRIDGGWINSNALGIIDLQTNSMVNTILMDDVGKGASNPWQVKASEDGNFLFVSIAGGHELISIDAQKLHQGLVGADDLSHNLTFTLDKNERYAFTELKGPRAVAVSGNKVYAAGYFSDNIAVFDNPSDGITTGPASIITLGPENLTDPARLGELRFHDASICFQQWHSCSSCHPGGARTDALNWDIPNDGLGNPKNGKSLTFAHQTAPMLISGIVTDIEQQIRDAMEGDFFLVPQEADAVAISEYLKTLIPVASPHLVNGGLTEAAENGKVLFNGKAGCAVCHPGPLYTDLKLHDVGANDSLDQRSAWDTPTLIESWRSAPYMHNGRYNSMSELLDAGTHKPAVPLTATELNELIEFVNSL